MSILAIRSRHQDAAFQATDSAETSLPMVAICSIIGVIVLALIFAADLGGGVFNGVIG